MLYETGEKSEIKANYFFLSDEELLLSNIAQSLETAILHKTPISVPQLMDKYDIDLNTILECIRKIVVKRLLSTEQLNKVADMLDISFEAGTIQSINATSIIPRKDPVQRPVELPSSQEIPRGLSTHPNETDYKLLTPKSTHKHKSLPHDSFSSGCSSFFKKPDNGSNSAIKRIEKFMETRGPKYFFSPNYLSEELNIDLNTVRVALTRSKQILRIKKNFYLLEKNYITLDGQKEGIPQEENYRRWQGKKITIRKTPLFSGEKKEKITSAPSSGKSVPDKEGVTRYVTDRGCE